MANLLAPVGAGSLSPYVTQQEYSKLFERDRPGLSSSTEYWSRGDWFQTGSQFGTFGSSAYAIDATYRSEHGEHPNADLEQRTLSFKLKQEITRQDSVYLQAIDHRFNSGDVRQLYDPAQAHPDLRLKDTQEPMLLLGYHREWAPGSHTILLAGRLQDTFRVTDPDQRLLLLARDGPGYPFSMVPIPALPRAKLDYESQLEAYSTEIQHIWQNSAHTIVVGGRFQSGAFDTRNREHWSPDR